MEGAGSTRRRFLQQGAGLAVGAAVGAAGLTGASARARGPSGPGTFAGELRLTAGHYVPDGWLPCRGDKIDRDRYPNLAEALGDAFGRKDGVPLLPDLRSRALLGTGTRDRAPSPGRRVGDKGAALCDRDSGDAAASLGLMYIISPHDAPQDQMIGEVRPFPYSYVPEGWSRCDGTELRVSENSKLFVVIGDAFGGDGRRTFDIPDLRGFTPLSQGRGLRLNPTTRRGSRRRGLAKAQDDRQAARLHMIHGIAVDGDFPERDRRSSMNVYLGEVRAFAGDPPDGWLRCNGQTLPIFQYQPLFSLLGTNFGGDGSRTFLLPDLRGRVLAGVDGRDDDQRPGDVSGRESKDAELIPYTAVNWAIATDGRYPPRP